MVMVKVIGVPGQLFSVGVAVMVPTMFEPVPFAGAVYEVIFPVPFEARPIPVFVFVQFIVVPVSEGVKLIELMVSPGHTIMFGRLPSEGTGFTVMVYVALLVQPLAIRFIV